jgi:RHS repeat-associated protein
LVNGIEVLSGGVAVQQINCGELAGGTITINASTFTNQGTLRATASTLAVPASLAVNGSSRLSSSSAGTITIGGSLLGSTQYPILFTPEGTLVLDGYGTVTAPQLLEVMGRDLGLVSSGFTNNFAYGTLALANKTYVELVDQSQNTNGGAPEALYVNSLIVPAGTTLDLNGLNLYARNTQIAGSVVNGAHGAVQVQQLPVGGALALAVPAPADMANAGELDDWTFFGRAGDAITVAVNPGGSAVPGLPLALSPALNWVQVQLLDPSGKVLATASDASAGAVVELDNIALPADGTYTIAIRAAASQSASTGNYVVAAFDVTPNVQTLNLNQEAVGNITSVFSLDRWNFSASAGTQVQLNLVNGSTAGLTYSLTGPTGSPVFTNVTSSLQFVDPPLSGTYNLTVQSNGSQTGSYGFTLNQTAVTALPLATTYTGTWAGSGQAQLFSIPVTTANPMSIVLTDPNTADQTELYARFGSPPTRQTYDYGANGSGSSQQLLVPAATAGTWYVLVYGTSIPSAPSSFTLQATSGEVVLTSTNTTQTTTNTNTTLTLDGAGFTPGSTVNLVAANGTAYPATSSSTDLPTQITANFAAGIAPAGTYSIKVTQPDGMSAILVGTPITIVPIGQGILTANIEVPSLVGRKTACVLYVDYSTTGNAPMPAPVLVLSATNPNGPGAWMTLDSALQQSGYWTSAAPVGFSYSVAILASGATPGVLEPGESERIPVYYAGWNANGWDRSNPEVTFTLGAFQSNDTTPVNWSSMQSSLQPAGISPAAWSVMYSNLSSQLGNTAGGYVQLLDNEASYLGQLGENITDSGSLWSFAVVQAENIWPLSVLGTTEDDSLPVPGNLSLSFDRSFNQSIPGRFQTGPLGFGWSTPWEESLSVASDGTVTVTDGSGAQYEYQPDSRYAGQYFSQPGDTSTLTALPNGYALTATDGTITFFNGNGTLGYLQDTNGNTITAGYTNGQLTSLTASSGQSLILAYNAAGRISSLSDSSGQVTTYHYDPTNQYLISVTSYDGQVTSYTYDTTSGTAAQNALTSITFPDGTHEYFTYDNQGRLASSYADGGTQTQTFTYSAGQVTVTDATGDASNLDFNENGQLAKTVNALGNPTFYTYDSNFDLTKVTNATGASASCTYNGFGQVTSSTDFLGNTTRYYYGGMVQDTAEPVDPHLETAAPLSNMTDANGNTTTYAYNSAGNLLYGSAGNLLSTTYANGTSESFTYNPLGEALSFVNANGQMTQYAYNSAGQLTGATFSDGSQYTYTYDSHGNLLTATDPTTGTVTFTYDPVTEYLTKVAYPNGTSLTFSYDAGGRRIKMVDQTGFTTKYTYNAQGQLAGLTDGNGNQIVSYTYDADGRLSKTTNGNGTYTTDQYDADGNVLHLINYTPGGAINSRFDYGYNSLGLETTEGTLDGTWTYSYDADGELTQAVFASNNPASIPNQNLVYNYDAMGNRTSTVINGVTTTYVSNDMNEYTSVGGVAYTYDKNGNLLSEGTNTYTYNSLNELTSVTNASGTTTYTYNTLGQRVASVTGGQTTQYLIDPAGLGNVVATYSGSGIVTAANLIADYTYGLGLTSQVTASGSTYYYDFDALGNTVALTNSSGTKVNSYSYLPFGGSLTSSVAVANPFELLGQWGVQTASGGLSFMQARYYTTSAGRFTSSDPLGPAGCDANLYRYAGNSPGEFSDPLGLSWVDGLKGALSTAVDIAVDVIKEVVKSRIGEPIQSVGTVLAGGATVVLNLVESILKPIEYAMENYPNWLGGHLQPRSERQPEQPIREYRLGGELCI